MSEEEVALDRYVEMSDDELIEALGRSLIGAAPGFGPADLERAARFARQWMDRRTEEFRRRLCGEVWVSLERDGRFDMLAEAAAVADALDALLGKPTAYIVAVILIRRGLAALCA